MLNQFFLENSWFILLAVLWVLPWKGVALWKASKNDSKWWFTALLVINTLGLLEILYIFFFSRKKDKNQSTQ